MTEGQSSQAMRQPPVTCGDGCRPPQGQRRLLGQRVHPRAGLGYGHFSKASLRFFFLHGAPSPFSYLSSQQTNKFSDLISRFQQNPRHEPLLKFAKVLNQNAIL